MTSIRLEDGSYYDLFEEYTKAQIGEMLDVYSRALVIVKKDTSDAARELALEECKDALENV